MAQINFSVADYCVFFAMLVISATIGLYYAYKSKHVKNIDEFLLGGRKLSIFPVAMSILASFTSAISILGFPSEMYKFGTMYWIVGLSYFICQPLAIQIFVPFFHNLRVTSAYEYLELRFNYLVRATATLIFCLQTIFYISVALYTPSVAIQQVTGLSLWISIMLTGIVCTFYTTLGGMKAVIWTDTFQVFVIFGGVFAIIIKGLMQVGGFGEMWRRVEAGQRVEFFDFNPNPFVRHTFWTIMVGGTLTSMTVYGSNQSNIQRYLSVKTVKEAKKAMIINLIGTFFILTILCLAGLIAYAVYYECDVLQTTVSKGEQILPYMVMDLLSSLPGVPGLFIACVYSAALSTISSGLNSLSTVCLKDFIEPYYKRYRPVMLSEHAATKLSKYLAFIFGIVTIGMSYACEYFGSSMLQLSLSLFGLLGGPLLGVISLGMFIKFANAKGAFCGLVLSTAINLWLGVGSVLYGDPPKLKPMSTEGCAALNITVINPNSTMIPSKANTGFNVYNLSYFWYSGLAVLVSFVFGITISLITGRIDPNNYDKKLFIDYRLAFGCCCKKARVEDELETKDSRNGQENLGIEMEENYLSKPESNSKEDQYRF